MEEAAQPAKSKRIPFDGDPAISFPVIGSVYWMKDYSNKNTRSDRRPAILTGYYIEHGVPVALDLLVPTSQLNMRTENYDKDRYDIFLWKHSFGDLVPSDSQIKCDSTLTVPNNKNIVVAPLPMDKICPKLFADYLLRRALILFEQKAKWRKEAGLCEKGEKIPGQIRHGFLFDGIDPEKCASKDRFVPDLLHGEHGFSHTLTGPPFIKANFAKIVEWAEKAAAIRKHTGVSVELPPLRSFPDWPDPATLIQSRSAQVAYMQVLRQG